MATVKSKNLSNASKVDKREVQKKNANPSNLNASESSDSNLKKENSTVYFLKMRWVILIFVFLVLLVVAGLIVFPHAKRFIDLNLSASLVSNSPGLKTNFEDSLTHRIIALEKSETSLSNSIKTIEELESQHQRSKAAMSKLLMRIAQLEDQQDNIRALIKVNSATEFSRQSIKSLENIKKRLEALEANRAISLIEDRVTLLETKQKGVQLDSTKSLQTTIAEIQKSLADIKKTKNRTIQGTQILAISQLREAIMAGRPFESELRALRTIADSSERLSKSIDTIKPYAKDGVLQAPKLYDKFVSLSENFATKEQKNEKRWFKLFADQLSSLVRVRRVYKSVDPATVAGGIAQIKRLLIQKNIKGAISILENLLNKIDHPDMQRVTNWLAAAKAHLVAKNALADLFSFVVLLSGPNVKD